ncbi:MAG: 30S ribosomal protein S12 methylthiotransferase RimO [Deltaproteobacteria bacterium]|nr:MAG: 30S ribosomal protein S12 methylthiotransferase RimO [Deltaproteobacteria bacterium]
MPLMQKVFLVSLGCAKNLVDSEFMLGLVREKGYGITDDPSCAAIALVNTCGFIRSAVQESIETILELAQLRQQGFLKRLVVSGCFVQRYGKKLLREIPEVDAWLGTGQIHRIGEVLEAQDAQSAILLIDKPDFLAEHTAPRVQTTPFYSAYLKIAEGCSHRCSYCLIPSLRGRLRSRTVDSLHIEAQEMVERGVKEINLVAQDTTWYGHDLDPPTTLEDLLQVLVTIQGLQWLRVLYAHPYHITERLLDLIESEDVLCPYLDIPMQHSNPHVLRAMGRPQRGESMIRLIERIRRRSRSITLRTTIMVGFPGETDEQFRELYDFVRAAEFNWLGVFSFSPEEGTAAAKLNNKVDERIVQARLREIMELQKRITKRLNQRLVGKTVPVLVEGLNPETDLLLTGRTATMAPDVDGQVLINEGSATVGDIVPVRITEAHPYDLVGGIVKP